MTHALQASILLLTILFSEATPVFAQEKPAADSALITSINKSIEALEKKVSAGDKSLPTLYVRYDFHDATEGVPPDFKFYFDAARADSAAHPVLRVCKVHIGHEVYSVDYSYYFDERGRPLKYLVVNSGVSGEPAAPASRHAIIYGPAGKAIWSSSGEVRPALPFQEVKKLFESLDRGLSKF